jgi:ferric-dicitrate binding protein FerR (iron transport regulator)
MDIPEEVLDVMLDELSGVADPGGRARLRAWIASSANCRAAWEEVCAIWYSGAAGGDIASASAWESILARRSRERRRRLTRRWAAAVCAAVFAGALLGWPGGKEREVDLSTWLENRAGSRVELVLADGRRVELGRPAELREGGARIASDSSGARYVDESAGEAGDEAVVMHELIVPRGGEYRLLLSDGTVAELNSGSALRFPSRFSRGSREVWLSGEAFFRVRGGAGRFAVHAGAVEVEVTGTGFNVSAYPDDNATSVTLESGSVEVRAGDRVERLEPGYRMEVDNETLESRVGRAEAGAMAWREGILLFDDAPLEELARRLTRWYDVPFAFRDEATRRARFSGGFRRYESLERVLGVLGEVNDISFRVENDTVAIRAR